MSLDSIEAIQCDIKHLCACINRLHDRIQICLERIGELANEINSIQQARGSECEKGI